MARGDIKIDYATNDLLIEKSDSNVFDASKHRYDSATDSVILTITIPSKYKDNDGWKTYLAHIESIDDIDASYDSKNLLIEYTYIDGNNLEVYLGQFDSLGFVGTAAPSFLTVASFKQILSAVDETGESTRFRYYYSEKIDTISFTVTPHPTLFTFILDNISLSDQSKSFNVDWGDGVVEAITGSLGNKTHTYSNADERIIVIKDIDMRYITSLILDPSTNTEVNNVLLSENLTNLALLQLSNSNIKKLILPDTLIELVTINMSSATSLVEFVVPNTLVNLTTLISQNCTSLEKFISHPEWSIDSAVFHNCNLNSESVNLLLHSCMTSHTTSATSIVASGGTNSNPDRTSGGVDGVQAYWNLGDDANKNAFIFDDTIIEVLAPTTFEQLPAPDPTYPSVPTGDGSATTEAVIVSNVLLGDFVVEDSVEQNEYMLLNIAEGSFLQSPISGVGLNRFLQSPIGGQEIIDIITNKFTLDSLRIITLDVDATTISVTSEPFEN